MANTNSTYDIVVLGSGASGMSAAIRAHDLGLRVVILEAHSKIGGSTAFSAGQIWAGNNHLMARAGISDTLEETRAYVSALNDVSGALDESAMDQWITEAPRVLEHLEQCGALKCEVIADFPDYYYPATAGSKATGRTLAAAPLEGATIGSGLRPKLLYSPHHPPGPSYAEMFSVSGKINELEELIAKRQAEDMLTMGTGIAAHLLRALEQRGVPILTEHRGVKFVKTGDAVTGVECEAPDGRSMTFSGAVVLATGSYDWNYDLVEQYSAMHREETGSVAPPGIRGDGHIMAKAIGAEMVTFPVDRAMHITGYKIGEPPSQDDRGFRYGASTMGWPHSMLVDASGKRFCDDSYYRAVVTAIARGEGKNPFFLIWDEKHHRKYGLPPARPGEAYPEGMGIKTAPTLGELAVKLGVDRQNFVAAVERFNENAKLGKDPDFKRGENPWAVKFLGDASHEGPSPLLGAIEEAPFFGMNWLIVNTGIGNAGVKTGLSGQALDTEGNVIEGLYAIGVVSSPTMMGTGYNSGFSVCRGLTYGYLAAEHIAKAKGRKA